MGLLNLNVWMDKQTGDEKQVMQLVADNVIVPTAKPRSGQNRISTLRASIAVGEKINV